MLPKTVIAGLAAAALMTGAALIPTGASAAGHGGAGNWPQPGTWNWPEYAGAPPTCNWSHVKYYDHGRAHWHWERVC